MTGRNESGASTVAQLARLPAWTVTGSRGRWVTAERVLALGGRRWVVGLTPTAGGAMALMLWCDDDAFAGRPWDGR
jgi:hypothetical protein